MKIVKLKGGLGNQMFQYAFAKVLEKITTDTVKLDYSAYGDPNDIIRQPRLNKYSISVPEATSSELREVLKLDHKGKALSFQYRLGIQIERMLNRNYYFEVSRKYIDPETVSSYSYYDGYWQSFRYVDLVEDEIKKDFIPKNSISDKSKKAIQEIQGCNSVMVGVRKGDYAKERAHYGSYGDDYYSCCMKYISERIKDPVFYIFSNDIEWCKSNLHFEKYDVQFRERNMQTDDFEELVLMSSCKHAIIINSTYHWWGAYLINNPRKIVCRPEKWFADNKPIDIFPEEWIYIQYRVLV